jgi:predicted anti-sigma-YlaC factor YlaD
MISCDDARAMLAGFLELSLAVDDEAVLREHLAGCSECRLVYTQAEPALLLSLTPAVPKEAGDDEDAFVAAVLGGVHQARFDRRAGQRRERRFLAAAAAVVLAVAGTMALRMTAFSTSGTATAAAGSQVQAVAGPVEPAFVEVEGEGVRLYQVSVPGAAAGNVQVAMIVNPRMEL